MGVSPWYEPWGTVPEDVGKKIGSIPSDAGFIAKNPEDLSKGPDAERLRGAAGTLYDQYLNYRPTPTPDPTAYVGTWAGAPDRSRELAAMDYMQNIAQGRTPSQAEILARQGVTENAGAQMGVAATLQGPNAGAARRMGMIGSGMVTQGSAADLAQLHAAEQERARAQLLDAVKALRGQDVNREEYLARLRQQQDEINNQYRLGLGSLTRSALKAPYDATAAAQDLQTQVNAANSLMTGSLLSSAGQVYGASRRRNTDEGGGFDNTGNMPPSGG